MSKPLLLCVESNAQTLENLAQRLCPRYEKNYDCQFAANAEDGLERINKAVNAGQPIAFAMVDYKLPSMKGDDFLLRLNGLAPGAVKVFTLNEADGAVVVDLLDKMKLFRFMFKPYPVEDLLLTVENGLEFHKFASEEMEYQRSIRNMRFLNKAAREISNEISFNRVVDRFLQITVDTTGAVQAMMLLEKNGHFLIEAIAGVGDDVAQRLDLPPEKAIETGRFAMENVNNILRSKQGEGYQLATPIRHLGKVIGYIYVERNRELPPFDASQREMLVMLSAQAAISFDKARLYEALEQKTRELELEKSKVQSVVEIVKGKNRDITESMRYAKRIQRSIIPSRDLLQQRFPDSFVFYKPKDIVSGDFYWWAERQGRFFVAACDCTGHGVPGALMSVICSNALDHAVIDLGLTDPTAVLQKINAVIRAQLGQDQEGPSPNDGMDLAFCAYLLDEHLLQFAGAKRPLYLLRQGEIFEYEANKVSIGGGIEQEAEPTFKGKTIKLERNDQIYIFSDGVTDQFGGDSNKKFMPRRLRAALLETANQPMVEQGVHFRALINDWRGKEPQTDDMLLIGVRYNLI